MDGGDSFSIHVGRTQLFLLGCCAVGTCTNHLLYCIGPTPYISPESQVSTSHTGKPILGVLGMPWHSGVPGQMAGLPR